MRPRVIVVCRRDELEQEYARLLRRLAYPGGKKARAATKRLRAFSDFIPARYLDLEL
jgi:hypothetical protein